MKDKDKPLFEGLDEIREAMQKAQKQYNSDADQFWNELPYEQKLMAFYSVCKRIWQGDVIDEGSYRYVLYDVFGFDMDSYIVGMDCHYMDLHNLIITALEHDEYIKGVKKFYDKEKDN